MKIDRHVLNYTDFSFQKFCEKNYGINRGVYNVIDSWFYEKGVEGIAERRREIIKFLTFLNVNIQGDNPDKIRFGKRGLSFRLNQYWKRAKYLAMD